MNTCIICNKYDTSDQLVKITEKGSHGVNKASRERGETLQAAAGDYVHKECRRIYTNPNVIKSDKEKTCMDECRNRETPTLRSKNQFRFDEHCLFCGQVAKKDRKKGIDIFPVRTDDFQTKILRACDERDDEWAVEVRGRIKYVNDLHAADALYHQTCSVNFRTGKTVPQLFSPVASKKGQKRGRPVSNTESFANIIDYLKKHEDEQVTIFHLVDKMKEECGDDAFSAVYMKKKLREHFGNEILITDISGKSSVVTLRDTATSILQDFYNRPKHQDFESEKRSIIKAAAKLLKSDIRSIPVSKENYPPPSDISSAEKNFGYVPESLQLLLQDIFSEKNTRLKISSIGQAIMQAARPRALITPLQLGLGVQLHHSFASRFLIDTLYNLGLCISYSEVHKFETSAAAAQGIDIPGYEDGNFIQYVADNVDHNVRTLDGSDTFHGMGIIAGVTPGTKSRDPIPRLDVSIDDLKSAAKIDIKYYRPPSNLMTEISYQELEDLKVIDTTRLVDFLSVVTWPLRASTPTWSGAMQMIQNGEHPGKSAVVFLPMIDMNASDISCVYSTMLFICSQARRYNVTPVLTFDQPLYWKAFTIITNEPENSDLKSIVLRLGGFHMEMSYLGCIGNIMNGSGLQEILEIIYASNAVPHMLSGKAVARAIRGHLLVDVALHSLLVSRIFNIDTAKKPHEEEENRTIVEENEIPDLTADEHSESHVIEAQRRKHLITQANEMYDKLLEGDITVEEVCEDILSLEIKQIFDSELQLLRKNRTAKLWIQYSEMVQILRQFIKAERTGNWNLHLQTVYEMLPYFAAAGHNLYAKSAYIYLMTMHLLPSEHPDIFAAFQGGHHVLRRSDRYWAGLSSDLMIEQVLMRSIKTSGGMTRGRGMGENQRAQWIMSMPACADMNEAMQQLTGIGFHTTDIHKEATLSRKTRDMKDILTVLDFLKVRNPFDEDSSLKNIHTGEIADASVNADDARNVGIKIIESLRDQKVVDYTFKKAHQAVTLASKSKVKIDGEAIDVDPQLLFQRCTTAASGLFEDPSEIFKYELCSVPSSLFESDGLPREAHKSTLAEALWNTADCSASEEEMDNVDYVLDGGSLLHRIPWTRGDTFTSICKIYTNYVTRKYPTAYVVFDGYSDQPTTKDVTHIRRSRTMRNPPVINFTESMPCMLKKDAFLANPKNKQKFINLLGEKLEENRITVRHAPSDADVLIVQTAVEHSANNEIVVIGEDTDLLVLLLYHAELDKENIYFKSEQKQTAVKKGKIWDISKAKRNLGENICKLLPVIHAFSGCDTTSRIFGIGKGTILKKLRSSIEFQEMAAKFIENCDQDTITKAGEEMMLSLYGGIQYEGLDLLRYRKFTSKVIVGNIYVQVNSLPPTSDSAKFHSLRSYLQCQIWIGNGDEPNPHDWGWYTSDSKKLLPVKGMLPPAPDKLLKIIRCNCKVNCDTKRCTCRKHGIDCSNGCGECRGISCSNTPSLVNTDLEETDSYDD